MRDNTTRFSNRVADYIRYRPGYPDRMLDLLRNRLSLPQATTVADIGAGTGISSQPFLNAGYRVFGVEPNHEMREAAAELFSANERFVPVNGSAEQTTLDDASVDLVFCGQAFHWFDPETAKKEFERILRPGGHIVLAWNERQENSPFQQAYEQALLDHIPEYSASNHRHISEESLRRFLEPRSMQSAMLENYQFFDLEGLKGRLMSSSYCPVSGPAHEALMEAMEHLYRQFSREGRVRFDYDTVIYWGE